LALPRALRSLVTWIINPRAPSPDAPNLSEERSALVTVSPLCPTKMSLLPKSPLRLSTCQKRNCCRRLRLRCAEQLENSSQMAMVPDTSE
jgi:hypothetical protein